MKLGSGIFAAVGAVIGLLGFAAAASADTFSLANNNGGDGYVTAIPGGFELFGANNGVGANVTTYEAIASTTGNLTFNWVYTTYDFSGSSFDPAGYVINNNTTQLSTNNIADTPGEFDTSGSVTLSVLAGQDYGFYVYSTDSCCGRGEIAVTATPLPSTWTMLIAGFLGLGFFAYRGTKKNTAAIAAA